ncbi:MAG: Holliday junction resolvase RuvX [Verrucomicrobiae bacterium]|nr:Holliday junction resolvase RuvX [Verrucomicrobiae bacterium]
MRILGLDHGTVRVGVAVSDELGMIAFAMEYIPIEPLEGFLERLRKIIAEKEVELIIVGMPRNMDGTYGPAAQKVREFIALLEGKLALPIKAWDERLTSVAAHKALASGNVKARDRKGKIDQIAAQILLQSYLDSRAL